MDGSLPRVLSLDFIKSIQTRGNSVRGNIRNVEEALRLIDQELPSELVSLPRWTFARALLVEAARSKKKRDLIRAARQFKQALRNEGWLAEEERSAERE